MLRFAMIIVFALAHMLLRIRFIGETLFKSTLIQPQTSLHQELREASMYTILLQTSLN